MYENLTDEQLLRAFNLGSKDAFAEIYNRHWDVLFSHALRMVHNKDLARDAVQDVFVMLLTKTGQVDRIRNVLGFLTKCMRNRILDYFDHEKIHADFMSKLLEHPLPEADSTEKILIKELEASDKALLQRVEAEISQLSPKMRTAFQLFHRDRLSHKEIASRTGTTAETIKKQVYYAVKILRGRLLPLVFVLIYLFKALCV